jgi:uncharacterized protein (DUF1501 family)
MLTRRDFLKTSSLLTLAPTVPLFLADTAAAVQQEGDRRVLVVVQLDGGNDALNTLVPFTDPNYAKLRPTLARKKNQIITVNDALGLHTGLRPLSGLMEAGQLAMLPGVSYPNPSRSHFTGMAVWHTAKLDPSDHSGYGWLGRALDPTSGSMCAVHETVPGALRGRRSRALSLTGIDEMLLANPPTPRQNPDATAGEGLLAFVQRQMVDGYTASGRLEVLARGRDDGQYPSTVLAQRLQLVARLLKADLGARVFYALQSGYDTHAQQANSHGNLLFEFGEAVAAFFKDLSAARLAERVTLLAFSEFGRTIRENGSAGTDHGTAGCVFLAGPGVKGGICGVMPSLTDVEQGEPKMTTDFRRVYATVLEDWLGLSAREVLNGQYERLGLFRV